MSVPPPKPDAPRPHVDRILPSSPRPPATRLDISRRARRRLPLPLPARERAVRRLLLLGQLPPPSRPRCLPSTARRQIQRRCVALAQLASQWRSQWWRRRQRVAAADGQGTAARECSHRMVDFVTNYYKSTETFPVLSQDQPGYLKELLPDTAPSKPDALEAFFDALGGGVILGTASEAVLVGLLAARDRTLRMHGKTSLKKLVVYASDQTHSSLQKACQATSGVNSCK